MGFKKIYFFTALGFAKSTQGAVLENDTDIVIAFRGTTPNSLRDWLTDASFIKAKLGDSGPKVHGGFYRSADDVWPFVREHVVSTLENRLRNVLSTNDPTKKSENLLSYGISEDVLPPNNKRIHMAGHSLGGALAIVTLGSMVINGRDDRELGYYFVDPTLKKLSVEAVGKIVKGIAQEEFTSGLEERTFSNLEEDDLNFNPNEALLGRATLQYENDPFSPLSNDNRLMGVNTFGAPRAGNWFFKYAIEKYAKKADTSIFRFENLHSVGSGEDRMLIGDLVPRIPLVGLDSKVDKGENSYSNFSHVGVRVFFNSEDDDVKGDSKLVQCEYTTPKTEAGLAFKNLKNLLAVTRHNMGLYAQRVRSYLGKSLEAEHSCHQLRYIDPDMLKVKELESN